MISTRNGNLFPVGLKTSRLRGKCSNRRRELSGMELTKSAISRDVVAGLGLGLDQAEPPAPDSVPWPENPLHKVQPLKFSRRWGTFRFRFRSLLTLTVLLLLLLLHLHKNTFSSVTISFCSHPYRLPCVVLLFIGWSKRPSLVDSSFDSRTGCLSPLFILIG